MRLICARHLSYIGDARYRCVIFVRVTIGQFLHSDSRLSLAQLYLSLTQIKVYSKVDRSVWYLLIPVQMTLFVVLKMLGNTCRIEWDEGWLTKFRTRLDLKCLWSLAIDFYIAPLTRFICAWDVPSGNSKYCFMILNKPCRVGLSKSSNLTLIPTLCRAINP